MGTTSEKLTYLNTTKGLIKDNLNLGGANITTEPFRAYSSKLMGIYKDFLANGTDTLWNNWEKVSGTGETLSLSPTIKGKMKVDLKGNTKQSILPSGYTQVEYIESSGTQYIDTGYKIKPATDIVEATISVSRESGSKFPFGTYDTGSYYGINFSGTATAFRFYNGSATASVSIDYGASNEKIDFKITPTTIYANNTSIGTYTSQSGTTAYNIYLFCASQSNSVVFNSNTKMYRFKITSGNNVVRDFIPCYRNSNNAIGLYDLVGNQFYTNSGTGTFTKGSNVPNPDYPQDIQVVSGDNTIKVEGKNLFNPSEVIASNLTTISGEEITINDNSGWAGAYVICGTKITSGNYKVSSVGNTGQLRLIVRGYKNGAIYEQQLGYGSASYSSYYKASVYGFFNTNETLVLDNTCDYYYVGISLFRDGTETFKLQLEKGSTATTYTPYVSQTHTISLGNIELCKIGDYQDRIFKAIDGDSFYDTLDSATKQTLTSGGWYKYGAIGKRTLISSDVYGRANTNTTGYYRFIIDFGTNIITGGVDDIAQILSNKFIGISRNNSYRRTQGIAPTDSEYANKSLVIYCNDTAQMTVEEFKTWITNNNVIIYYVLATPTYTKITDTTLLGQLEAIKYSYESQTNITQEPHDLPFYLDVRALKEI